MSGWYISNLDQSVALGTEGAFAGYATPAATVNGVAVTGGSVSKSNLDDSFKIRMNTSDGYVNTSSGTANFTSILSPNVVDDLDFTAGSNPSTSGIDSKDALEILALGVFGARHASDLFSNASAMEDAYDTAFTACHTQLNDVSGLGANVLQDASVELANTVLLNAPERFALEYRTSCLPEEAASDATYTSITLTGATSGADDAVATIVIAGGGGLVSHMEITTASVLQTYAEGENVTFTIDSIVYEMETINSVQQAMLNGKLEHADGFSIPMEASDVLDIVMTIPPHADQNKADGEEIVDGQATYTLLSSYVVA